MLFCAGTCCTVTGTVIFCDMKVMLCHLEYWSAILLPDVSRTQQFSLSSSRIGGGGVSCRFTGRKGSPLWPSRSRGDAHRSLWWQQADCVAGSRLISASVHSQHCAAGSRRGGRQRPRDGQPPDQRHRFSAPTWRGVLRCTARHQCVEAFSPDKCRPADAAYGRFPVGPSEMWTAL